MIFGCAGPRLTPAERRFFAEADPLGFILFARNCIDRAQLAALTDELRDSLGRADAPILVDQEGGRVARLAPPQWRAYPPAAVLGALGAQRGAEAAWLVGRLIAADLARAGISVDCAPVLDVPSPGAHDVIGDRAFGTEPGLVATLGRALATGLMAGGVLPVIKHIPGHGRARADSHEELPRVDERHADLAARDFAPFEALADMPWAMTAHVLYQAIDPERPATQSPKVIAQGIRREIGFAGVLISDDIGMNALAGGPGERARDALDAGCDVVLHCSGALDEMREVADAVGRLGGPALDRLARAEAARTAAAPIDEAALAARLAKVA